MFCKRFTFSRKLEGLGGLALSLLWSGQAHATQVHASPEGLFAHQIAHGFFAVSMGILIYWLRHRELIRERGWKLIQFAAFFFILWNIDASFAHYLEGQGGIFEVIDAGTWHARVVMHDGFNVLTFIYYLTKLDHLLCVPAIVLLYFGLRQLLKDSQKVPT